MTVAASMAGASLAHMPILCETLAACTEGKRGGWAARDCSAVTLAVE